MADPHDDPDAPLNIEGCYERQCGPGNPVNWTLRDAGRPGREPMPERAKPREKE